jgi:hypothetical protein
MYIDRPQLPQHPHPHPHLVLVTSAVQLPHQLPAATPNRLLRESRKYVSAKDISKPVKIAVKGKERWISTRLISPAKRRTSF